MEKENKNLYYEFFWEYFNEVQKKLLNLEELNIKEKEEIFRQLQIRLMVIDKNLGFEISRKSGLKREFIITANGVFDLFPTVRELVKNAPKLMLWEIKPFKQRINETFEIKIGNIDVSSSGIFFDITQNAENENLLDLRIYLENMDKIPENYRREIIYQLLDGIIGEEDVETCVGIIEEADNKELTKFDKVDLINKVDNLKRKKEMANGKIFN
jgi:hypothetical protein